jgi:2-polyprenyl-6-methoxyphenol hydroxylase-like FAD-dependent oxidoreductase
MANTTLIIVGAGPVGMLAALLAAKKNIATAFFEKSLERQHNSRAIGITPPSLEIFQSIGLDREFISNGIIVKYSEAHSRSKRLGKLNFNTVKGDYPFILSIPQDRTELILEKAVLSNKNIRFYRGYTIDKISDRETVVIHGTDNNGRSVVFSSDYLIASDGGKSTIRKALGIKFKGATYHHTFLMGDFEDNNGWGTSARIYFTRRGSVESFPIAGNKRRYVLRTSKFIKENTTDFLEKELFLRAGVDVSNVRKYWESGFGVQHYIAASFAKNHVFFCGDSAHIMSPIGGQNMNTGFADTELAVWLIGNIMNGKTMLDKAINLYNRARKRAVMSATLRAGMMMRLGTSGGRIWSPIRNFFISVMLHTPAVHLMLPLFTMQSIPYRNIHACKTEYERALDR